MCILSIETTGPSASVAISGSGKLWQKINNTQYSHLEQIVPMTAEIMSEAGIGHEDLNAVAVSRGPGSFTGVRIGMATAKGLAQVWNKPVIEVPTLASFAFGKYSFASPKSLICPVFDARRSQVYAAAYPLESDNAVVEGAAYDINEYLAKVKAAAAEYPEIFFFGDGCKVYEQIIADSGLKFTLAPENARFQQAANVARLAEKLYAEGRLTSCYECQPDYMREAEAERKLKEKNAK